MTEENSDIRFDDELGVNYGQDQVSVGEQNNHFEFEVETDAVFKRLAEDIYQSTSAGIREPLTNAITSVIRAEKDGYIEDKEEGMIVFELYDEGESRTLIIRDNGVGMTREEIDKVVTRIGKSTTRSKTELTGRFGMGFLATWMLAGGTDGGFFMYSNPRGVEEGPFEGIWTSNGFTEIEEDIETYGGLDENEYGIELEITLDNNISTEKVVNWIDKYSEWSRVPILARYHDEDGVSDEEYPPKSIKDKYEAFEKDEDKVLEEGYNVRSIDGLEYYTVEHEAFNAINSNIYEDTSHIGGTNISNWILMDVPISFNGITRNLPLPSIEVRLKNETPYVVDGPHEGCYVETGSSVPENIDGEVINIDEVTDNDVVTPYPTGTRDALKDNTGFINWLSEKFETIHYKKITSVIREIDTLDDYYNMSDDERDKFHAVLDRITNYRVDPDKVESKARTTFSKKFKSVLPYLDKGSVSLAPEGNSGVSRKSNRKSMKVRDLLLKTQDNESQVYMAHRIKQENAEFVWDSEEKHFVVRVESSRQDDYKKHFGWKMLNDLDFEVDLKMDESTRKEYIDNNTSLENQSVTIHIGSYSNTCSKTVKEIIEASSDSEAVIEDDVGEVYNIDKSIIFRRGGKNISEYENLVGDTITTISVSNDVYHYLKDNDNIWTAEKAINHNIEISQSNGDSINITEDGIPENCVVHVISGEETIEVFRDPSVMSDISDWICEKIGEDTNYIPLTKFEIEFADIRISWDDNVIDPRELLDINRRAYRNLARSDVSLYAKAVIDKDLPEVNALEKTDANWDEGGKELVESVESTM